MTCHGSRKTLLVGEICIDVTLMPGSQENKLRLGGIVHAARGFWAFGHPFEVAAVVPSYLENSAAQYLKELGCVAFHKVGNIMGAPSVTLISDATEVADQGYDVLLRDEKQVVLTDVDLSQELFEDVLLFPGTYDLRSICNKLPQAADLHLDIAYDLEGPEALKSLPQQIATIMISTSSPLFLSLGGGFSEFSAAFIGCGAQVLILKENRGGSRMSVGNEMLFLPAQLGETVNSIGVGDVFAAAFIANLSKGPYEAGLRATRAASSYSQTIDPDLFGKYVRREQALSLEDMEALGGVSLSWEARQKLKIYFAAPDFTYADRLPLEHVIAALKYHNFVLRRPIVENGELPRSATTTELAATFKADCELLKECDLVFAVPLQRDPGTLVEIGLAIEAGIPVVVYDASRENNNTMVMAGASHYSSDLDSCLNATFMLLSKVRRDE